jgi:hypothetical protein
MPSTPGHYLGDLVLIGDVVQLHHRGGDHPAAARLRVQTDAVLHLAVIGAPPQWPAGLAVGGRLWVKGRLRVETEVHRRNVFYLEASHIEVVRAGSPGAAAR